MDKVLFICLGDPLHDLKGDMRIVRDRAYLLRDHFNIDCISIRFSIFSYFKQVYPLGNTGFKKITYVSVSLHLLLYYLFKTLFTKPDLLLSTPLQLLFSTLMAPMLQKSYCSPSDYSLIHAFHIRALGFISALPAIPLFIDLIDSYTLNISRSLSAYSLILKPLVQRELRLIEKLESNLPLPHSKVVVSTVSHVDRLYLSSEYIPDGAFNVFPQLVLPSERLHSPRTTVDKLSIIFFGNLDYLPNKQAVLFLCNYIENYRHSLPKSFSLTVAGRNLSPRLSRRLQTNHISAISPVTDMQALVSNFTCSIAPMFHGSGIQSKILESMSWGVPVITTPLCIQSLYRGESSGALTFQTVDELHKLLTELAINPGILSDLSNQSYKYIQDNYSLEILRTRLVSVYRSMLQ